MDRECTNYCNKDGSCGRCGACCVEFLPLSKTEAKLLKSYVKEKHIKLTDWVNKETISLLCPFLSSDMKSCLCYEVRPKICRSFKCNKDMETIEAEKKSAHLVAYYNRLDSPNSRVTNLTSIVEILTGKFNRTILLTAAIFRKENKPVNYAIMKAFFEEAGREDIANSKELKKFFREE